MKSTKDAKPTQQVYQTSDYARFKLMEGNRPLNILHLSRLKESIAEKPLVTPIVVNEDFLVVDGQHRLQALKELGLPVNYLVLEGYGLNEVHTLNQNAKTWKADDFLQSYCDLDMFDYKLYRQFKEKYGFGHYDNLWMLTGKHGDKSVAKDFMEGKFKVKNFKSACNAADKIVQLGSFYPNYKRRSFVHCMLILFKNEQFDFDVLLHKLAKQPNAIKDAHSTEAYKEQIEKIYNHCNRNKINLRFVK